MIPCDGCGRDAHGKGSPEHYVFCVDCRLGRRCMLPAEHKGKCKYVKLCGNRVGPRVFERTPATERDLQSAKNPDDCRFRAEDRGVEFLRAKTKKVMGRKHVMFDYSKPLPKKYRRT